MPLPPDDRFPVRPIRPDRPPADAPLLLTADTGLLDDLLRLCAAAGVEPHVATDAGAVRAAWRAAPLVVVGQDRVVDAVASCVPRRGDVVLVGLDLDDARVWEQAVALGAEHVVFFPDAEPWLVDRLADAAEGSSGGGLVVGVLGGRGGAGATTLAAALAVSGAREGRRVLLVDGDPLGGGIDLAIGGEDVTGLRWPELAGTRGRVNGSALREALPCVEGLAVLSWDRSDGPAIAPEVVDAVLAAARRGSDLVVVDLPRRFDPAAELALARCDVALLVVPAEVRATAAAARVAAAATLLTPDLRVVVRGPAPTGLTGDFVADALALPLAGAMRLEPHLDAALDRGEPPGRTGRGPLARFCSAFLAGDLRRRRRAAA